MPNTESPATGPIRPPKRKRTTTAPKIKPLSPEKAEELAAIRNALREAVEQRSLRSVAREIGMSPTGLHGMIVGAQPYVKTWEKLRVWYGLYLRDERQALASSTAAGLLQVLLRGIPLQDRHRSNLRVLNAIQEAYRAAGVEVPQWVPEVRTMLGSG